MIDVPTLPKDPIDLCRVIDYHVVKMRSERNFRHAMWHLASAYLSGYRVFELRDRHNFRIEAKHLDSEGKLQIQVNQLLDLINKVSGLLESIDIQPQTLATGSTLKIFKDRALSQILLESATDREQLKKVASEFAWLFSTLGACGLTSHIREGTVVGLTNDLEVIHPLELFPWPSVDNDVTKQRGIIWERMLPLEFLKETIGKRVMRRKDDLMSFTRVIGESPDPSHAHQGDSGGGGMSGGAGSSSTIHTLGRSTSVKQSSRNLTYTLVQTRELWVYGERGTCVRHIVCSGDVILSDEEFTSTAAYCPVVLKRFYDNGTFLGAGLFDLLFSVVRELENLIKSAINNVKDVDRYPILVIPQGVINERTAMREVGKGLRYISVRVEQNFTQNKDFRPMTISPHNAGDMPEKTAEFLQTYIDRLSPMRDLIKEKGRIDSLPGLRFLEEQELQSVVKPSNNFTSAFGEVYRAAAQGLVREMLISNRSVPVTRLSIDLAGAIIDFEESTISFGEARNNIPDLTRLRFTTKGLVPKSKSIRKQEAVEMLDIHGDLDNLIRLSLDEDLDIAMHVGGHRAALDTVTSNILVLYGDGQTPGEYGSVWITPFTEKPEFQLQILSEFMSSRHMRVASSEVVDAFIEYKESLMSMLDLVLPEQIPDPIDQALIAEAQQAAGQQPNLRLTGSQQ